MIVLCVFMFSFVLACVCISFYSVCVCVCNGELWSLFFFFLYMIELNILGVGMLSEIEHTENVEFYSGSKSLGYLATPPVGEK